MRISDIDTVWRNGEAVARGRVTPEAGGAPLSLWYHFTGLDGPLESAGDAYATAMLPACMAEGEACRVAAPLSPEMARGLGAAQTVLADWYDDLSPVAAESTREPPPAPATPAAPSAPGVACCFSGGVDSWYSLLKNAERVTHLLLVRGFDIGLENDALWYATRDRLARIAEGMGIRLVTCETNLRAVADKRRAGWGRPYPGDFWGKCLHGAALASVALMLPRTVGALIVPATHSTDQLKPWGSSPKLDPCWSNGRVEIIHDGCEADRTEKVRTIAGSDLALETLRVCHNDVAQTNCGRCEKCVRTMVALRLCGALERTRTFPDTAALQRLRRLEVPAHLTHHYTALLRVAREVDDVQLVRAIEAILGRRFSAERALATLVRRVRRGESPLRATRPARGTAGHAHPG